LRKLDKVSTSEFTDVVSWAAGPIDNAELSCG
jgi:hypothetical protein